MNHIYKVIFNKATATFVAVAEYARGQGKKSNKGPSSSSSCLHNISNNNLIKLRTLTLAIIASLGLGMNANAASYASPGATATGSNATAIGNNAKATNVETVAIGSNTDANGYQAVAVGNDINAVGDFSIVIGTQYNGNKSGYKSEGEYSVAIGSGNNTARYAADADGDLSVALGSGSRTDDLAISSVAVGSKALTKVKGSVALGAGSVADRDVSDDFSVGYDASTGSASTNTSTTWKANSAAVSIGNGAITTRQITGLAAGSKDTDAVNIAQLKALEGTTNTYFHTGTGATGTGNATTNKGKPTDRAGATATNALAAGVNATATADRATAIGYNSKASGGNSIAQGTNAVALGNHAVSIGTSSDATKDYALALGASSKATGLNTTAVGYGSKANSYYATAIGHSSDALANSAIALGRDAQAIGVQSSALGKSATASKMDATALGRSSVADIESGVALGSESNTYVDSNVAGYDPSKGTESTFNNTTWKANRAAVAVGSTITVTRQITSVAAGSKDTDAVNIAQLKALEGTTNTYFHTGTGATGTGNATTNKGKPTDRAGATATHALAAGVNATATADRATAVGYSANATGIESLALGRDAQSSGGSSSAIGRNANATGLYAISIGNSNLSTTATDASGAYATAIGYNAKASGRSSIAQGTNTEASGDRAIAQGMNALAKGDFSIAIGGSARALRGGSLAFGKSSYSAGANSIAFGEAAQSVGNNTIAIGADSVSSTTYSIAIGRSANAKGSGSTALGGGTSTGAASAIGSGATAIGGSYNKNPGATAEGVRSLALGNAASATFDDAVALGSQSVTTVDAGIEGISPLGEPLTDLAGSTWTSTRAAVSVGDVSKDITRQITSVAAGSKDTDAVNVAQLKSVANTPMTFTGNTNNDTDAEGNYIAGDGTQRNLGQTLEISGGATDASSNSNVKTVVTDGKVDIQLLDAPTFAGVVKANGFDASGQKITNVADGQINSTSTDAVNGSQLNTFALEADRKNYFHVNDGTNANTGDATTNLGSVDSAAGAIGIQAITAGQNAKATGEKAVAIGKLAHANGEFSVAIGSDAQANGLKGLSVGSDAGAKAGNGKYNTFVGAQNTGARSTGEVNTYVGTNSGYRATGDYNNYLGSYAGNNADGSENTYVGMYAGAKVGQNIGSNTVSNQNTVIGHQAGQNINGNNNIITGYQSGSNLKGERNIVIGNQAGVQNIAIEDTIGIGSQSQASSNNATAIGKSTQATVENSVALGSKSVANRVALLPGATTSLTANAVDNTVFALEQAQQADKNAISATVKGGLAAISVGNTDNTRQITNLAAGSEDSDAVNVAQLKSVANTPMTFTGNTNNDTDAEGNYIAGDGTQRNLGQTLEISGGATDASSNSNVKTVVTDGKVDIQLLDAPTFAGVVKANGFDASGQKITNVADGKDDADAVNVSQLNAVDRDTYFHVMKADQSNSGTGDATTNLGKLDDAAGATGKTSVAAGENATASGNRGVAVGFATNASGQNTTAIGYRASAKDEQAIAIGYRTEANGTGTTSVGSQSGRGSTGNVQTNFGASAGAYADGYANTSVGGEAGSGTLTDRNIGHDNVSVGYQSGSKVRGSWNTAVGSQAGRKVTGAQNTAVGRWSGQNITGADNTTLGVRSGQNIEGNDNLALGVGSGNTLVGNSNIAIGESAGVNLGTTAAPINRTISVGRYAKASSGGAVAIGSGSSATEESGVALGESSVANTTNGMVGANPLNVTIKDLSGSTWTSTRSAISVGDVDNDITRQITDVAAGTNPTDAVNVAQLAANVSEVESGDNVSVVRDDSTGHSVYKVSAEDTTVTSTSGRLKVTETLTDSTDGDAGIDNYDIDLSQDTIDAIARQTSVIGDGAVSVNKTGTANASGGDEYQVSINTDDTIKTTGDQLSVNTGEITDNGDGTLSASAPDTIATTGSVAEAINNSGFTIKANGDSGQMINPGDEVDFIDGKNIEITRDAGKFTVATKADVDFDNVTVGPVKINNITGINAGGTKITNLAAGIDPTDAVNVSQLTDQVASAKTEVVAGTNIKDVTTTQGANGQTIYTVNAEGAKISADSSEITVTPTAPDANNVTDYKVDLSDTTKADIADGKKHNTVVAGNNVTVTEGTNTADGIEYTVNAEKSTVSSSSLDVTETADATNNTTDYAVELKQTDKETLELVNKGFNIAADNGADDNVKLDETVNFTADDSNIITKVRDNEIGFKLSDNVDIANSLTVGPVVINKDTGIDAGGTKITNLAAGIDPTDAVNVSQLTDTNTNVAKGFNVGDGDTNNNYKLGDTVSFTEADGNVVTKTTADGVEFGLADKIRVGTTSPVIIDGDTGIIGGLTNTTYNAGAPVSGQAATEDQLEQAAKASQEEVKSTDNSLTVATTQNADGADVFDLSVNTDDTTLSNGPNGLQVNTTPLINTGGKVDAPANPVALATSGDIANAINNSGFTIKANGNAGEMINPGDEVDFIDGKNIAITRDAGKFTVATKADVQFDNVTVGPVTINKDTGIDAGDTIISGVKAGVADTDAVNVSQLTTQTSASKEVVKNDDGSIEVVTTQDPNTKANIFDVSVNVDETTITKDADGKVMAKTSALSNTVEGSVKAPAEPNALATAGNVAEAINNSGFTVKANGGAGEMINPGDEVDFIDGKNIAITRDAGKFTVATKADVQFDNVTVGPVTINKDTGIDAGDMIITGVKAGVADTDAVNVSQLKSVAAIAKASKTNVKAGKNTTVTGTTDPVTGAMTYVVDADSSSVSAGSDAITVTPTAPDANNVTDYKVDLSDKTKNSLAKADTAIQSVSGDKNITTTTDPDNNVTVSLNDNITVKNVDTDNITIGKTVTINNNGMDAGDTKIANVSDGIVDANSKDAVNGSQLFTTNKNVQKNSNDIAGNTTNIAGNTSAINKGLNVGDGKTANNYKLGDTVNVTGDKNITTKTTAQGVEVGLAQDVTVNSIRAGKTSISKDGVNAGGNRITNVAPGVADNDAVNVSQLNDFGYKLAGYVEGIEQDLSAGIASAAAIENAPYVPGKWTYAAGASHYNSESAIGLSLRRTADNGRWSINGGVSTNTQNDPLFRIGVSGVID